MHALKRMVTYMQTAPRINRLLVSSSGSAGKCGAQEVKGIVREGFRLEAIPQSGDTCQHPKPRLMRLLFMSRVELFHQVGLPVRRVAGRSPCDVSGPTFVTRTAGAIPQSFKT